MCMRPTAQETRTSANDYTRCIVIYVPLLVIDNVYCIFPHKWYGSDSSSQVRQGISHTDFIVTKWFSYVSCENQSVNFFNVHFFGGVLSRAVEIPTARG